MKEETLQKANEIKRKLNSARAFKNIMTISYAYISIQTAEIKGCLDPEYNDYFSEIVDGIIKELEMQLNEL